MIRRLQIICAETGDTVFRGVLHFVCIEISTGLPKRPPKTFIDIYGPAVMATASR
jgi:acyl-CoA thioester hydrolase